MQYSLVSTVAGLGKTLQTSAVIAASAVESARASAAGGPPPLPSLVVCPATLVEHWAEEVHRWIVDGTLRVLPIQGHSGARRAMWEDVSAALWFRGHLPQPGTMGLTKDSRCLCPARPLMAHD